MDDQLRVYPNRRSRRMCWALSATEQSSVNGRTMLETSGQDGIELTMNSALSGVPGWRVTETDRRQRELVVACAIRTSSRATA